jgi:hypothetical protein
VSSPSKHGEDTAPPTDREVAERLGVDGARLRQFVNFHPAPTPSVLLGWAYAEPKHEAAVGAWLDARTVERGDFSDLDPVARDDDRRGRAVR